MSGVGNDLRAGVRHFRGQCTGEIGVMAHLRPQSLRRIRLARRIVVVLADDEERRLGDKRNFMCHRFTLDQLRGIDEGTQPARIFRALLDAEARVDERRDRFGR